MQRYIFHLGNGKKNMIKIHDSTTELNTVFPTDENMFNKEKFSNQLIFFEAMTLFYQISRNNIDIYNMFIKR